MPIGTEGQPTPLTDTGQPANTEGELRLPPPPGGKVFDHESTWPSVYSKAKTGVFEYFRGHPKAKAVAIAGVVVALLTVGNDIRDDGNSAVKETVPHVSAEGAPSATTDENEVDNYPSEVEVNIDTRISDEGTVYETIELHNGTTQTREYLSPYSYSETISNQGQVVSRDYKESSLAPLVGIDHQIYEVVTEVRYEDFLQTATTMIPEISGEPYDAENVLTGYYQRIAAAMTEVDPRYIEISHATGTSGYRLAHSTLKNAIEDTGNPDHPSYTVILKSLKTRVEPNDEVFTDTTDTNVSMSTSFTAIYSLFARFTVPDTAEVDEVQYHAETTFVRQDTPMGEMFLATETKY